MRVAYKPKGKNRMDKTFDVMANVLFEDYEEKKTRYWFKFMDERMYDGEETHIGYAIFCVCFGLLIIVISYLAMIGVI